MSTPEELRTQPHDEMAEQLVLGSMINSVTATKEALGILMSSDYYVTGHGVIHDALAEMYDEQVPIEIGVLHSKLLTTGRLQRVPGGAPYLIKLMSAATDSQVAYYANIVADLAMRRAYITAGQRIGQRAFAADGLNAHELGAWAQSLLDDVAHGTGVTLEEDGGLSPEDFMGEPPAYQWVIPRLLERTDRLVITGGEGSGKSTLVRQIAVMAAAGIHPFDLTHHDPRRVMVFDCENSRRLSMRSYAPLIAAAEREGRPLAQRLRVNLRPRGLDLTQRSDAGWVLRQVEAFQPELVTIGPLYRLHSSDPNDELAARRVSLVLDRLRGICGSALLLEAHSPHQQANSSGRNLRPIGSSLWLRWPEFGYGIHPAKDGAAWVWTVMDIKAWRGPRDERIWPKRIRRGGAWPWIDDEDPATKPGAWR